MLNGGRGTKAAQIGKLLTVAGFRVLTFPRRRAKCLKRPDGGVVTQRTANPNATRANPTELAIMPVLEARELLRGGCSYCQPSINAPLGRECESEDRQ
jgi:hypothetical protein